MKRLFYYLALAIIIWQSALLGYKIPKKIEYPAIDSRLAPYLVEFAEEAKKRGVSIDIEMIGVMVFTKLPKGANGVAGFCSTPGYFWERQGIKRSAVVLINQDYEAALGNPDDYTFKSLIYHELGHCLLYRGHDPAKYLTIMTMLPIGSSTLPYYEMSERYKKTWKAQLDDLFLRPEGQLPSKEFLVHGDDVLEDILRRLPVGLRPPQPD